MKLLSVGFNGATAEMRSKLQFGCKGLSHEGFSVAVEEINKGNYTFLGCNVCDGELSFRSYERLKNLLKNYVAKILTDWIVFQEEPKIVRKIIDNHYCYFTETERSIVYENSMRLLNSEDNLLDSESCCDNFNFTARHNLVLCKIAEYLDSHHELVVEGFIRFRLKDYRRKLALTTEKAVDDFIMELEYKEFIRVLRYFVDIQEPRIEEAHVIVGSDGTFRIVDCYGQDISNRHLEKVIMQKQKQSSEELSTEDMLVSSLITIAPRNIMIHNGQAPREGDVADTIKSVFADRVVVCDGCKLCKPGYLGSSSHEEF